MNPDFLNRDVNANFSGGEKKRNEILQLSVLEVRPFVHPPFPTAICTHARRAGAPRQPWWDFRNRWATRAGV